MTWVFTVHMTTVRSCYCWCYVVVLSSINVEIMKWVFIVHMTTTRAFYCWCYVVILSSINVEIMTLVCTVHLTSVRSCYCWCYVVVFSSNNVEIMTLVIIVLSSQDYQNSVRLWELILDKIKKQPIKHFELRVLLRIDLIQRTGHHCSRVFQQGSHTAGRTLNKNILKISSCKMIRHLSSIAFSLLFL